MCRFKICNDTLGHKAGDEILKAVAEHMLTEIKPSDTIARIGGDEFTLILNDIQEKKDTKPFATTDPKELLEYADIAMYRAKESREKIVSYTLKRLPSFSLI